ncbi:type I-E CRISPR-associated protein Cse2/CasB [Saccharothrix hoggarensis]|uniref:Type I-E CRISPR-associated protein Cse2/CasB n=1 Tax=Saccharothrix hoggarensis TaxID=913853 RepID=A0ABW3QGK5_9PSEU
MTDTLTQRRRTFVNYLHGLHYWASSDNPKRAGEARQALARLRRIFSGSRQQADAYEYVFPHDPPHDEQDTWLLVAGLFALHPQRRRAKDARRRSLGASMGELEAARGPAVTRRFTQLLARDRDALPHNLRQTVRLLSSHDIRVDFDQLLDDLVVLLGDDDQADQAHRVRLRWAGEFHRPPTTNTPQDKRTSADEPSDTDE